MTKDFIVVLIDLKANPSGLKNAVVLAQDGDAYQVERSVEAEPQWEKDDVITIPLKAGKPDFPKVGAQSPRPLPKAPPATVREMWQSQKRG